MATAQPCSSLRLSAHFEFGSAARADWFESGRVDGVNGMRKETWLYWHDWPRRATSSACSSRKMARRLQWGAWPCRRHGRLRGRSGGAWSTSMRTDCLPLAGGYKWPRDDHAYRAEAARWKQWRELHGGGAEMTDRSMLTG